MQAIILAAGMGKRLKELTQNNTKCMVKVNGVSLIDRMLHQIERQNVQRIVIVVGYEAEKLRSYISTLQIHVPVIYVENKIYDKTNNIYSLSLASEYLCQDDTLLFESDIIFEDSVLDELVDDSRPTLALVDKYESWMDGTCLKIDDKDNILEVVPGKKFRFADTDKYYKTVNIYKFSKDFSKNYYVPFLDAYQKALGENEYYEQVLRVIAMLDDPEIKAKRLHGQKWYEIDDIQDLDIASSIFTSDADEKVIKLKNRYGGYWRYPKLLDFCYLVNPYFPPQKMVDEIKANFDVLLRNYPSGMQVNSLLAAKNFNVHTENIIVGNGAAELIKSLMTRFERKIGVIRPTFEEYPNRYDTSDVVEYYPKNKNCAYNEDDLIDFFYDKNISSLILINPDNPSGNYIHKNNALKIISWCDKNDIRIVVDESFADFSDEEDNTFITQNILDRYKKLYVMKSISKSYGVPGLRLGILASGDTDMIAELKKDVSIWNINSFAEFFMQILGKYSTDYKLALSKIKQERDRFENELSKIKGIRVIPSQANYIMIELLGQVSASELTKRLLINHEILVKDLSEKISHGNYLRIAVRNSTDNDRLINSLRTELNA